MWGATQCGQHQRDTTGISIHAPRVGSDQPGRSTPSTIFVFQSTLPVWGATKDGVKVIQVQRISIHAPRVGSDPGSGQERLVESDFNPRSPCGERPDKIDQISGRNLFQSTLPVWGATKAMQFNSQEAEISIHAPRVGSDSSGKSWWSWPGHFNPRSPCGERR